METFLPWIKKIPKWILGFLGLVTAIVTFLILFQENFYLVTAVIIVILIVSIAIFCLYVAFAKTPPLIEGGKGVFRYGEKRYIALICFGGIIGISLLVSLTKTGRNFVISAFSKALPVLLSVNSNTEWKAYIDAFVSFLPCQEGLVLPHVIQSNNDLQKNISSLTAAFEVWETDFSNPYDLAPGGSWISLYLTSLPKNKDWIKLSNTFKITIIRMEAPDYIDIAKDADGCGGAEGFEEYADNEIQLLSKFDNYDVKATFSHFDYYSLQPGEYGIFNIDTVGEFIQHANFLKSALELVLNAQNARCALLRAEILLPN